LAKDNYFFPAGAGMIERVLIWVQNRNVFPG
jgi:hypothetical protein